MSCIITDYSNESSGILFVQNDSTSGKTITNIRIASQGFMSSDNVVNDNVSIAPGEKSKEYEIEISNYPSTWGLLNRFRVFVTLDDNTWVELNNVYIYEDYNRIVNYNGTDLSQN